MDKDQYVASIKGAFVSIGTDALLVSLTAQFPILANGFFQTIARWVIKGVLTKTADTAELGAFFIYVDFRSDQQASAFEEAAKINMQIQISGTAEEKENAEKKLVAAFRDFAKFTH